MDEILLIQQAKKGNKEAFNQLLQPYIQKAYRTSYLILNDKGLAEDAVQESLIQTYQSMKRFNENIASFKTWFHQILIHTTLKQKRKKRFAFLQIETWFHIKDESTPEGNFLVQEETEMIMDMVRKLSMKHQVVIILFYYQELSIIEIAQVLDIKEGTVKSRLHQAREKLKEYLTKMNFKNQETEVSTWINK
ncbi:MULTISPECIES: RNA polymerase sigma factor [Bacillus cereus group]|uniref:RNA polymerase subunit sigma-70 n=1 Tax=Bacillus cereus TaxID=1396 RepID=A0AA44QD30_BACCE|nr:MULTISPECIES: RNA polymerase sigma factor [Bacillus cereus group]PFN06170.1 RNA polymerase subunit sigma-70 [Bacillus cereus]PFO83502.1 RNA polymerase subunit sigma-70 [Bacillus cereus]PFR32590.1 RNA polymerase subunit sigma-70 [Bacillus cereus]PFS05070.1 RNA polymerase subunit sigma-70 [Bacillus cereus]